MKGKLRHYYPGGNTAKGFFSYYDNILDQSEAEKIICIKGGPGTGKSTFMKEVGNHFFHNDENVDMLYCSSDNDSLDGIVLRDRKIAFLDGTRPHVVDPLNPGAVDHIINLGEYWDEMGLRLKKDEIIQSGRRIKGYFDTGYNYLAAAGKIYDNLAFIYDSCVQREEVYMAVAGMIEAEFSRIDISFTSGSEKRLFLSAITPEGTVNFLNTFVKGLKRVYAIVSPVGYNNDVMMNTIRDSALFRGLDVETYYCTMSPDHKIEHILVPKLDLAFVTLNYFHDLEVWEIGDADAAEQVDLCLVDINDMINWSRFGEHQIIARKCENTMESLIDESVERIRMAKREHDILEGYYIPNMDFKKIDDLKNEMIDKVEAMVL